MSKVHVFVYGTLRQGGGRGGAMEGELVMPEAYVDGFKMLNLGAFPGVIPGDADDMVRGEVWKVDEDLMISVLDRIEGYRASAPEKGLYNREVVEAYDPDGECVSTWIYIFNRRVRDMPGDTVVESGDWFEEHDYYSPIENA